MRATVGRVSVKPASYDGSCPHTATFTGRIAVDHGPATVTYRWIRSDGVTTSLQTVSFSGSGAQSQIVQHTRTFDSPGFTYTGWEAITLVTPTQSMSNQANFTITCAQAAVKVSAVVSANPDKYDGDCSSGVSLGFNAAISVSRGPVTVSFRWIVNGTLFHNDSVTFNGTGPQQQTVGVGTLVSSSSKWEAHIEILAPTSFTSNQAYAEFLCKTSTTGPP